MVENVLIAQKLGCDLDSLDNCILIKASVGEVSTIIEQYFGLEVRSHCKIADYVDVEEAANAEIERRRQVHKSRPDKSFPSLSWGYPCWRYFDRNVPDRVSAL
ncbi:MAG: hypothetical protein AAGG51_25385 [Cyanobacteria bacterium P01_G01_bin.54]